MIEKVQIRAVNCISGLQGTYEEKCKELGLDTLEERRRKQDLLQTYKICNGKDKIKPDLLFTTVGENPDRQTRFTTDPLNITVKRSRIEIRKNLYTVRVAGDWNKLNHDIKTSSTAASFKNAIKFLHTGRPVEGPAR